MRLATRLAASLAISALVALPSGADAQSTAAYRAAADRLIDAAMKDSAAWLRIAELTDSFGHRLSGSSSLERAIDWTLARMKSDGLENVRGEPVMVPHWVRGAESAELVAPRVKPLAILGLGGSDGTPAAGVTAPVIVVSSFDDLTARAATVKGKIVLFDVPFTTYDQTVVYRVRGASAAAKLGAVAMLLRSVASFSINSPHTGSMRYDSTVTARIPAAAVAVEDAMLLHRLQDRGVTPTVRLRMSARTLPDAPSRNVVAELRGREKPDEVVVFGGHIDSWDVGQGAMDDAGGVVAAWEAVRLMKTLGLRPRRTIRVVGWTNEENGTRGGRTYRTTHAAEVDQHVFALESDNGVFRPYGIAAVGTDSALAMLRRIAPLLARIGADSVSRGEGEADIGPLLESGVPGAGLHVDGTRYFWYHHSNGDTPDKLDPGDVARCVATMAVYAYVLAEMPETLPRTPVGTAARRPR
ncbi:MAG TPA: M28 family metallopeptidase [Gemmatimonadaceae bacterium]|nr:M28 family metallopeptidase [Gemmatimonadaceae bacterium]